MRRELCLLGAVLPPSPANTNLKNRAQHLWNSPLTLMCCDGCSPFTVLGSVWGATTAANYLSVWVLSCLRDVLVTKCTYCGPSVTAFHAPALSLVHVSASLSAKKKRREKMRGEKEIGWERQACRVTFCLGVQAIVRWGRQHQSLPLHWLAEQHTHTYTHTCWTKTASGRHVHSSIRLNSYVNTQKT